MYELLVLSTVKNVGDLEAMGAIDMENWSIIRKKHAVS